MAPRSPAYFRFYAELNDFLRPGLRAGAPFRCDTPASVKHAIESFGVPHGEVDLVLVDGESVGFSHRLKGGETVSVYPVFESLDISPVSRVRPEPLRDLRFVLDCHLGRLARYLRLLGFDTLYHNPADDGRLAEISASEKRVLLTRDRGLLLRRLVERGYYVREQAPARQAAEVLRRFDLARSIRPFRFCLLCNEFLEPASPAQAARLAPPRVLARFTDFRFCPRCSRLYWPGSHFDRMRQWIARLAAAS